MRLRFVVIGQSSVGKTSAMIQYTKNTFSPDHDITIGVDFMRKNIIVDNYKIELQIWDCAGLRAFKTLTHHYYQKSCVALCIFDLSSSESLNEVVEYLLESKEMCPNYATIVLVGNKKDLPRKISLEDAQEFALKHNVPYFEISSKTGENIENMFIEIVKQVLKKISNGDFSLEEKPLLIQIENNQTPTRCCTLM
jgi:small GTP-binding protein